MSSRKVGAIAVGIAFFGLTSTANANSIHHPAIGASGNGELCSAVDPATTACQSLTDNPIPDLNVFETSNGSGASFYDIFAVQGIAAGTNVTFTFSTPPPDGDFGAFLCNNFVNPALPGTAFSADGVPMSTACTGLAAGSTDITGLVGDTPVTNWNFTGNGGVSTWFFFALAPNGTTPSNFLPTSVDVSNGGGTNMPEPGGLALLSLGLAGLLVLGRRAATVR